MVDVAVQDEWVLYRINKDKADESLSSTFDIWTDFKMKHL